MKHLQRLPNLHMPFRDSYDADAHLRHKKKVFVIGGSLIKIILLASTVFPNDLLPLLAGGDSPLAFWVVGYFFAAALLLRANWLGDGREEPWVRWLINGMAMVFALEVPMGIWYALLQLSKWAV